MSRAPFYFLPMWKLRVALVVKKLPANAGDVRNAGLIPGLGRSSGGGHGNSLQCSCLENSIDRGAWWATVHRVAKSQTRLKWLSTHSRTVDATGTICTKPKIFTLWLFTEKFANFCSKLVSDFDLQWYTEKVHSFLINLTLWHNDFVIIILWANIVNG